jgi:sec-independent protein translocase protein TatA
MYNNIMLGFFPTIGPLEMLVIAGVALLIFGNKLPDVGRSLGRGIVEFKKGLKGVQDDIEKVDTEAEKNTSDNKKEIH